MKLPKINNIPFRSKETSWLSFNARVLQEAEDSSVPLLERLRFLGIYSSNLDEFFRVRVANLRRLAAMANKIPLGNLPDPKRTLTEVKTFVKREAEHFDRVLLGLTKELQQAGVHLITERQVPAKLKDWLADYFLREVRPRIMPTMLRSYSRLSLLRDHPLYLAVQMGMKKRKDHHAYALIEIPTDELPRFVVLPEHEGRTYVMYLEDIIRTGIPAIFTGLNFDTFNAWAVKFTRDAELSVDDDITESLIEKISDGLKAREGGTAVRMNYDQAIPEGFLKLLRAKLKLGQDDTLFPGARYHNRRDFLRFPNPQKKLASYPVNKSIPHPKLSQSSKSLIQAIRKQDILLHFPYHSFDHFLDLLREASIDPMVLSIKLTQYRVARQSGVAKALTSAARNGKSVTVLVEPRARFDEKNNIEWAGHYQEAGIKVILGIPSIKVHAKLCLITRSEGGQEVNYAAIGTGNFNEDTSRLYTDHMLLTADKAITKDVDDVFRYFQNTYRPPQLTRLVASPFELRERLKAMIEAEIQMAALGRPAEICLKLNNLSDFEIASELYRASAAGVKLRILCRGMFSLVPGLQTTSKTLEARGIIDRYLEHSRILIFTNGGDTKVFLSSADFLARNFDSRFEVLCPILDKKIRQQLQQYFELQWQDNQKARVLDKDLTNHKVSAGSAPFRSQDKIRKWLKGDKPQKNKKAT